MWDNESKNFPLLKGELCSGTQGNAMQSWDPVLQGEGDNGGDGRDDCKRIYSVLRQC